MPTELPDSEYRSRLRELRGKLANTDADAAVWFSATSSHYVSGFEHVQTERPVVLALSQDRLEITVPRLEVERVETVDRIDAVHHYFDYPQGRPIETAAEMLEGMDADAVVADSDGAPGVMGYEGPALSTFVDVESQSWVLRMRWEKTDAEIELIQESANWGNLAHRYLAEYAEPGAHPATVSQRASMEASRAMLDTLGDRFVDNVRGTGPAHAGFISAQETALPHGHTPNQPLERGDVLITGASANVDGYNSELERTMFVGEVSDDQEHYFDLMVEAQDIAIDALGPGVPLSSVDEQVWAFFEEQHITDLAQHHVGHNIGLDGHEPPYIDRGWDDYDHVADGDGEMQPGQVYTIEPGIYTETEGYRHSDTIAITENGTEWLTYLPRDLDSNVITE